MFLGPHYKYMGLDLVIISPALSTALVLVRTTQGLHVHQYSTSYSAALCDALISFLFPLQPTLTKFDGMYHCTCLQMFL